MIFLLSEARSAWAVPEKVQAKRTPEPDRDKMDFG